MRLSMKTMPRSLALTALAVAVIGGTLVVAPLRADDKPAKESK